MAGTPRRFAAATAAYTMLRTASGRREALAELLDVAGNREVRQPVPGLNGSLARIKTLLAGRIRHGLPLRIVPKLMIAATASALAVVGVGWQPSSHAVGTAGRDLARPDRRPRPGQPTA